MKISVIIPTYNHGKYLEEAINSVLLQTYSTIEIIVVNDGSTDNTADILKPYLSRIHYFQQENKGISAARNAGIQQATGDYLAFLDADNKWCADKLERQFQVMQQDPSVDMTFGHVQQYYCQHISMDAKMKLQCPEEIIPGINASTMLIKSASFHKIGYFDSQWSTGEFIDWYIKAQTAGLKENMLDDLVLYRRIHEGHLNMRTKRNFQHYIHILRKKLNDK